MAELTVEKFDRWKNRIEVSKKRMDDSAPEWEKYRKAYEGDVKQLFHEKTKYDINTTVNWTYIDVRSSVPRLYSQTPEMNIDPEEPEADLYSEIMEKVVNILKDKKWKLRDRMRDLVKGSKLSGRDYLKVYYNFKKEDLESIGTNFEGERSNDEIMIDWIPRETLLLPVDATSFDSAKWVAHEIKIPLKEGMKKFGLKESDKPATTTQKSDYVEKLPMDQKQDFQYLTYYEIEDRVNRELSVIVKGINRFVVKPYKFPYPYYSMYVPLEWNDIPGRGDTKADPHFWWGLQMAVSEKASQQLHHSRKLNAKYWSSGPKPLDDKQIAGLRSNIDSEVVQLGPGQKVEPFIHANLGQETYLHEQTVRQDLGVVSGVNEIKQGTPQKKKTAREAVLIAEESQSLSVDRATQVEKVLEKVISKCVLLIQKFYDRTRVIRLTGMEEVEFLNFKDRIGEKLNDGGDVLEGSPERPFIKFVGTQMKGEMSVRVSSGSTRPQDEESRKNDVALLLQLSQQFPPLAQAIDPQELGKEIIKLLHFQNKNIIVEPNTPEQENILLKRNIPVMPMINEDHARHLQAHMLESNNTEAFMSHILAHRLYFKQKQSLNPQGGVPAPQEQPNTLNDLAREGIPGTPQAEQVQQFPSEQAPGAVSPGVQPPQAGQP